MKIRYSYREDSIDLFTGELGGIVPHIICDVCDQPIHDLSKGHILMDFFSEQKEPMVTHAVCDPDVYEHRSSGYQGWGVLLRHLAMLLWNAGKPTEEGTRVLESGFLRVVVEPTDYVPRSPNRRQRQRNRH